MNLDFFSEQPIVTKAAKQALSHAVPWDGYQKASLISEEELGLIVKYERASSDERQKLIADKPIAELLVSLLSKLTRSDTMQYLLALVYEACKVGTAPFHRVGNVYDIFLKLLEKPEESLQLLCISVVSMLVSGSKNPVEVRFDIAIKWIELHLGTANADVAFEAACSFLRYPNLRDAVWKSNILKKVVEKVKGSSAVQTQYECLFIFWMFTFEQQYAALLHKTYDIMGLLVEIAKAAVKEKLIRLIVAIWRNMVEKAPEANLPSMLVCKVLNCCQSLATRKLKDEEVNADVEFLVGQLSAKFQSLSSWEEYVAEIKSGKLDWTPPHLSDMFWKNNAGRLNDNKYELLRSLATILASAKNPIVLAVASHDIGQYVKYCTSGKKMVEELGVKQRIMELMSHTEPDVRYQSLLAVQKYMVNVFNHVA